MRAAGLQKSSCRKDNTDVMLTREGFEPSKLIVNLHHMENGEQCTGFSAKKDGTPTFRRLTLSSWTSLLKVVLIAPKEPS